MQYCGLCKETKKRRISLGHPYFGKAQGKLHISKGPHLMGHVPGSR